MGVNSPNRHIFLIYFGFRKKNQKDFWLYKIFIVLLS